MCSARCAATSRVGLTSCAFIEPETSSTRTTVALSVVTSLCTCGRATATQSVATASRKSARRDAPPPRPPAGDRTRARRHSCSAPRSARAAAPRRGTGRTRRRDDEQRQEQEWVAEVHAVRAVQVDLHDRVYAGTGVNGQRAPRPPATCCVDLHGARRAAADGGVASVEADRVRRRDEPLMLRAPRRETVDAAAAHRTWLPRRSAGLPGGNGERVGKRWPPPDAGTQPMCGRNVGAGVASADAASPRNTTSLRRRDPRIDRAAERAAEADVDAAARLSSASRPATTYRFGHASWNDTCAPRVGDHPRAGDGDADLQAAALVRRAARRRAATRTRRRATASDERRASRTTLRNRNAENTPPARSSTSAPTSEEVGDLAVLGPMTDARRQVSCTPCRARAVVRARKNSPPLSCAICCSVPGSAGRGSARCSRR